MISSPNNASSLPRTELCSSLFRVACHLPPARLEQPRYIVPEVRSCPYGGMQQGCECAMGAAPGCIDAERQPTVLDEKSAVTKVGRGSQGVGGGAEYSK